MLLTDFQDLETPDDVVDVFFNADHSGGDIYKSNIIMTCNWLLGRQKVVQVGEEDNLYVPGSSALAGKIYSTLMSQVVAGKKFGGLNDVESVRFDLKKSEISEIERMGLVPMVNEYSKVMAFSAKTLFNGDNLGLQTYSVVRVFDYISKVLFDFLNRRAFENWTTRTEADLRSQIVKFLDSIQGPTRLIEKFRVMRIEQDPNQRIVYYLIFTLLHTSLQRVLLFSLRVVREKNQKRLTGKASTHKINKLLLFLGLQKVRVIRLVSYTQFF